MPELSPRHQSIITALSGRLKDADALEADGILKEIEASAEYNDPSHQDHVAYLNAVPLALGRSMELQGIDPIESGNDSQSSMLDNQRTTFNPYPEMPKLDFSKEEADYQRTRKRTQDYLTDLQQGNVKGIEPDEIEVHIEETQKLLLLLDKEYAQDTNRRDKELSRIDAAEDAWSQEQAERRAEMKHDFMATRLKGVLKDNLPKEKELAEEQWARLQADYNF